MEKGNKFLTVLKIFGIGLLCIAGFGLIGLALYGVFVGIAFYSGFASIVLFLGFYALVYKMKLNWDNAVLAGSVLFLFAFIGMCVDARGNWLYNLPLEWLFAPSGTEFKIIEKVSHYGGTTSVNYDFAFVNSRGRVMDSISFWIIYPFRYIEYWLVGSFIISLYSFFRIGRKKEENF